MDADKEIRRGKTRESLEGPYHLPFRCELLDRI
jgi:hypothetical protein